MTAEPLLKPINIFYSYAHEDESLRQELDAHLLVLRRSKQIQTWHHRMISPGSSWEREIETHLETADIILLLISPAFMASDYAYSIEMQRAMQRHQEGNARVIPILLRPVPLQNTPIGSLQGLPRNGKPVIAWARREEAFAAIAQEIQQVVKDLQAASASQVNWVETGKRAMANKEYGAALDAYEQAIAHEPTNAATYVGKGNALRSLGRHSEALVAYDHALRLEPDNVVVWLDQGHTYFEMRQFTSALSSYMQVILLDPSNVDAYTNMGDAYWNLKQFDDALASYQRAIDLNPSNVNAYIGKGQVLFHDERFSEALTAYEHGLILSPEDANIHFLRANLLFHREDYTNAAMAYTQAIKIDPLNSHFYLRRGKTLFALQQYRAALMDYEQAIRFDSSNALAYHSKAIVLRMLGEDEEAAIASEQAMSLGFNVKEAEAMESSPLLRTRIELVQQFLKNAAFDCSTIPGEVGWRAMPRGSQWRKRFHTGLYVRVLFDSELDRRTVTAIYHTAKKFSNHALVIINRQPTLSGWGEINILRGQQGRDHFVCLPIAEALIQEGIASNKEMQTLQIYVNERLGSGFDPYNMRDPVSGAVSFFGRQRLTEEILEIVKKGQRLGLFGIQKMGKSSVLQELQKKTDFPVAYVYLQMGDSLGNIYRRILDDWSTNGRVKHPGFNWKAPQANADAQPQEYFDKAVRDLLTYLGTIAETSPMLGIFLDEIENIMPYKEGDQKILQLYISLMDTLRGVQQETKSLALLVAGVHPGVARYNYFWGNQKNPMHQIISEQFLPPLDKEDCAYMIHSLGKQINLTYEENALDYILEMSGSHPFLARQICSLANKKRRHMEPISVEIVQEVVQEFVNNPQSNSYFDDRGLWGELAKEYIWSEEVGQANHALLSALARAWPQLLSENELYTSMERKVAQKAFYALKERCLIHSPDQNGYYQITFGLFREWIRSQQLDMKEWDV